MRESGSESKGNGGVCVRVFFGWVGNALLFCSFKTMKYGLLPFDC